MFKTISINCKLGWLLAAIMLTTVLTAGCGKEVSDIEKGQTIVLHASFNTNQFLLNKLGYNRVLFIGDFEHRTYLYKKTVTDFLNYWIDQIEAGAGPVPRKLFLILELDSLNAGLIRPRAANPNLEQWLARFEFDGLLITTADFQFYYHDLSDVCQRINAYNACNPDDSIFFDIVGRERIIDLKNWSVPKRDSFFVYERDQYSSAGIVDLLERNPDYKAVIFYGGMHLVRTEVLKATATVSDHSYYLGHFLAKRFEDDGGVYGVHQASVSDDFAQNNRFMLISGKQYAIDHEFLDLDWFEFRDGVPNWLEVCDGSIIHPRPASIEPPLMSVWSQRIVDCMLGQIDKYLDIPNEFGWRHWLYAERVLRVISGMTPKPIFSFNKERWNNWRASAELDLVEDISTLRLWQRMIDSMEIADEATAYRYDSLISGSLRETVFMDSILTLEEKVSVYREYLKLYGDVVVTENLVHLLLVGTDEEIAKALPILRDSTGQDFTTPWEWADWFRGSGMVHHPY